MIDTQCIRIDITAHRYLSTQITLFPVRCLKTGLIIRMSDIDIYLIPTVKFDNRCLIDRNSDRFCNFIQNSLFTVQQLKLDSIRSLCSSINCTDDFNPFADIGTVFIYRFKYRFKFFTDIVVCFYIEQVQFTSCSSCICCIVCLDSRTAAASQRIYCRQ